MLRQVRSHGLDIDAHQHAELQFLLVDERFGWAYLCACVRSCQDWLRTKQYQRVHEFIFINNKKYSLFARFRHLWGRASVWQQYEWKCYPTFPLWFDSFSKPLTLQLVNILLCNVLIYSTFIMMLCQQMTDCARGEYQWFEQLFLLITNKQLSPKGIIKIPMCYRSVSFFFFFFFWSATWVISKTYTSPNVNLQA